MKLFLISQDEEGGYDTYDSAVVCAEDEDGARQTHPSKDNSQWKRNWGEWCESPDRVSVEYLGEAKEGTTAGVVCASFNAG